MAKTYQGKLPPWLKRPLPAGSAYNNTQSSLNEFGLQTICTHANCPNRGECWDRGTATVLILGDVCTRNCKFCSVASGKPMPPDPTEPQRLADLVKAMNIRYLVITSVNRDDLQDKGAGHFCDCINAVRSQCPDTKFEILTPDFTGYQKEALLILKQVLPLVFAHNVETVPDLYTIARQGHVYTESLNLLKLAKDVLGSDIQTKSSIMLGIGETDDQVIATLKDLRLVGCDRLTIGQYLRPSKQSLEVIEYITPEKFQWWQNKAYELGFSWVISTPFARSSYCAEKTDLNNI